MLQKSNHIELSENMSNFVVINGSSECKLEERTYFYYIKLHGSCNWLDLNNNAMMIVGTNKKKMIEKYPLIKRYTEIFKKIIKDKNKKLLVIGYGFKDKHINEIIIDGIKNYNLKVYIINPIPIEKFRNELKDEETIFNGMYGYYQCDLLQIFSKNNRGEYGLSSYEKQLNDNFFSE